MRHCRGRSCRCMVAGVKHETGSGSSKVTLERRGHILLIGVNRPEKRNAWDVEIIRAVAQAYTDLAAADDLRAGVVFGHGDMFTAGLDLASVAPLVAEGRGTEILPPEVCDPWDFFGEPCPKPIVLAVHGRCYTLGIELALASQACVAASGTIFAQAEVARGIVPLGGASFRLPARAGRAGMQWLLTGEEFDAEAALAAGVVTEIVPSGRQLERAIELAEAMAANAPLGVQAALAGWRAAERAARDAAAEHLRSSVEAIFTSGDAIEGFAAMLERRTPQFKGR
jgi:enoyl-CoA hydratase